MKVWIPTAVMIVSATTGVGAGPCSPQNPRNCLSSPAVINFSSVPAISQQIVSEEQRSPSQQKGTVEPLTPAPYTGPTFGTSLGKRAPTVGYQWSLE